MRTPTMQQEAQRQTSRTNIIMIISSCTEIELVDSGGTWISYIWKVWSASVLNLFLTYIVIYLDRTIVNLFQSVLELV